MNTIDTLRGAIARTQDEAGIESARWAEPPSARIDLLCYGICMGVIGSSFLILGWLA